MGRKDDALREQLAMLRHADPTHDDGRAAILRALTGSQALVVAAASRLEALEAVGLDDGLVAALHRILEGSPRKDPGCRGKSAIVRGLIAGRHLHADPYLLGIRHEQWEGRVDTAVDLRSASAIGLAQIRWPSTPVLLAELLCDAAPAGRIGAVRALAVWGDPVCASAMLRLRVLAGERDSDVLAEAFEVLMDLDPDVNLPWVVAQLFAGHEATEECAALALGGSRHDEALAPLQRWVGERPGVQERRIGLVAIGLLRSEASIEVLLHWLAEGDDDAAAAALEGLAMHAHDDRVAARVRDTARGWRSHGPASRRPVRRLIRGLQRRAGQAQEHPVGGTRLVPQQIVAAIAVDVEHQHVLERLPARHRPRL